MTTSDRGEVLLTGFVKLVIALAVFAVVAFDAVSVGITALHTADDAGTAASTAQTAFDQNHSVQAAYAAAVATLQSGETIPADSFSVDPSGVVRLQVRRTATTLLLQHIGPLRHYATVLESGQASPPTA